MTTAIFDMSDGWAFFGDPEREMFYVQISDGDNERFGLEPDFRFRVSMSVNGDDVAEYEWPPAGGKAREMTRDRIFDYSIPNVHAEDTVNVAVSAFFGGEWVSDGITYSEPYPPKDFDSWIWQDDEWKPPKPWPNDGVTYDWDESVVDWIPVEEQ